MSSLIIYVSGTTAAPHSEVYDIIALSSNVDPNTIFIRLQNPWTPGKFLNVLVATSMHSACDLACVYLIMLLRITCYPIDGKEWKLPCTNLINKSQSAPSMQSLRVLGAFCIQFVKSCK